MRAAFLFLLAVSPAFTQISDGTFAPADWRVVKLSDENAGETDPKFFVEQRTVSGALGPGNPGEHRSIRYQFRVLSGDYRLLVGHVRNGVTWNPLLQGVPESLTFRFDIRTTTSTPGHTFLPMLVQNDTYYVAISGSQAVLTTWDAKSLATLRANSFTRVTGTGPALPNFASGELQFGYATELRGRVGCASVEGCYNLSADISRESHIDNWQVIPAVANLLPTTAESDYVIDAGDPISTLNGEFYLEETDTNLGGPMPLVFARYYGAFLRANSVTSTCGANWMHNFDLSLNVFGHNAVVTRYRGKRIAFEKNAAGDWVLTGRQRYPFQLLAVTAGFRFLDAQNALIYTFDATGSLTGVEDRNRNRHEIARDAAGRIAQVSDGLGRTLTLSYTDGNLSNVKDQTGRTINFTQTAGNLTGVTNRLAENTKFTYVSNGLLQSRETSFGETSFTNTFDSKGRVVRQLDPNGNPLELSYDKPAAGATSVVNALGETTQFWHDRRNWTRILDPQERLIENSYNAVGKHLGYTGRTGDRTTVTIHEPSGRVESIINPDGETWRYDYEQRIQGGFRFHDLTSVTTPSGGVYRFARDASGNVTAYTNTAGKVYRYTYNARGQVATETNPIGGITTFTYNPDATLRSAELPKGGVRTYFYDSQKRLNRIVEPDQTATGYLYDAEDRVSERTLPGGKIERVNIRGNVISNPMFSATVNGQGRTTSIQPKGLEKGTVQFDALGRIAGATSAGGGPSLKYDSGGHLSSVSDCQGDTIRFLRDAGGGIEGYVDGNGRIWKFTVGKSGEITGVTTPLGRVVSLRPSDEAVISGWTDTFDAAGRLETRTDGLGRVRSWAYDGSGRTAEIRNGVSALSLSYKHGKLATLGDLAEFAYDDAGDLIRTRGFTAGHAGSRLIEESNGIRLGRDSVGHLNSVVFVEGKEVRYEYDCRGLVTSVTDWTGAVTRLTYDGNRQLASVAYPNGFLTSWVHDEDGQIAKVMHTFGESSSEVQVTRDVSGRIVNVSRSLPRPVPDLAAGTLEITHDAANQSSNLRYDEAGRVISDGFHEFEWNAAGWLTRIDASQIDYDAFGRPIAFGDRRFTWNDGFRRPTVSIEATGEGRRYFVHLPSGELLYSIGADDSHRIAHFDETGSMVFTSDHAGEIAEADALSYGPFGERGGGAKTELFTWRGRSQVLTLGDYYWMQKRWYDPANGVFLSTPVTGVSAPTYVLPQAAIESTLPLTLAERLAGLVQFKTDSILIALYEVLSK